MFKQIVFTLFALYVVLLVVLSLLYLLAKLATPHLFVFVHSSPAALIMITAPYVVEGGMHHSDSPGVSAGLPGSSKLCQIYKLLFDSVCMM